MLTFNHKTVYSFWDDHGDESFRVGFYIGGNEKYSLFELISTRGYSDGLYLTDTEAIYRADCGDSYTRRIERLFAIQKQKHMRGMTDADNCSPTWLFEFAKRKKYVLSVQTEDGDTISGYVHEYADAAVTIDRLNDDGEYDGVTNLLIEKIIRIRCNSGNDLILQQLSNDHQTTDQ